MIAVRSRMSSPLWVVDLQGNDKFIFDSLLQNVGPTIMAHVAGDVRCGSSHVRATRNALDTGEATSH